VSINRSVNTGNALKFPPDQLKGTRPLPATAQVEPFAALVGGRNIIESWRLNGWRRSTAGDFMHRFCPP
jgi:hypothetical protein